MALNGKAIEATKSYKVAGWAPVAEANKNAGPAIWDVVEMWLKDKKTIAPMQPNIPTIKGVTGNIGYVAI